MLADWRGRGVPGEPVGRFIGAAKRLAVEQVLDPVHPGRIRDVYLQFDHAVQVRAVGQARQGDAERWERWGVELPRVAELLPVLGQPHLDPVALRPTVRCEVAEHILGAEQSADPPNPVAQLVRGWRFLEAAPAPQGQPAQ